MNTFKIDNDILINTYSNFEKDSEDILFSTDINFIQFHFCLEGKMTFSYQQRFLYSLILMKIIQ